MCRAKYTILVLFVAVSLCRGEDPEHCLHHFKEHRGVITTPGFPGPFPVPIKCKWVINATGAYNSSIVVYLTQLYVTSGLKFTEYGSFEGGRGEVGLLQMNEKRMERTAFLRSEKPYLVIELDAESLEGNHFRALNNLLDVFGFNITYEIVPRSSTTKKTCTALGCSLAGNCYATWDFSEYRCSCFKGFHGKFCGHGPLCDPSRNVTYCHNGGVCTHMGAEAFKCTCPDHFSGPLCEKPKDDTDCKDGQCSAQCPFNGGRDSVCNCGRGSKIPPDRTRYEGTFRLVDWTKIREIPMKNPENIIEKELINYMSHNLSKVENLKVLNITPDGEMTFHFFGVKDDRGRVRAALNGLLQKGRLGNLTLHDTRISFKSEPALLLEAVRVNRERILRVDDEFTLSCIAKGSQLMEFRWYKDGVYVNVTAARRHMWQTLLPKNSDSQYTALLSIDHATKLDTGQYTCQVVDWGIQHCKSIYLEVLLPPIVKVNPMSVTLEKGQNVNITCMSPNDKRYEKFGYIWTKNKKLLGIIPGREVIEDLYPVGTILKIFHAQASATYTCHVSGNMAVQNFSVRVEVVDKEQVPLCPEEKLFGVMWPAAAPAQAAIQECPKNYLGNATRMCVLVDVKRTKWQLPDFSNCESEYLENIFKNFRNLMLGYQNTTGRATLQALLYYLQNRTFLYPGEGERVIEIVKDVQSYLNKSNIVEEFLESSQAFYHIMALLLEFDHSIINRKKVIQFQQQMKTHALVWGSLMTPPNSGHIVSNSLVVDIACLEGGIPNNMRLPLHSTSYPSWFTDKLDVRIEPFATDPTGNGTFSIAITVYRNLSKFLPLRYVKKLGNGVDVEYEFNSKIVMVELSKEGREIGIIPGTIGVVIDFDHVTKDYTSKQWNTTCGLASLRNVPYRWDLNTCILRTINNNITRCECDRPGAYAVLLTTHITPPMLPASLNYHVVVVVGCACCLIQTVLTLFLLLPYWWHHRTCLIFLKLQCCTATTGAMAVFLYAVRDSVPKASYPYVSTSLEAFLLVGMSSHLSKLLIVYTEVAPITNVKHLKETVVSIITGVPVLAVFCNHLAHHSTGWHLKSWWLVCGTMIFNIFVASAAIMMVMFIFLYYSVMQKLKILAAMNTGKSKVIGKRVGLLQCAAIIFSTTVVMETASIFYINVPNIIFHYFFSFTSALLGFIIFLCYILKSETPLHIQVMLKLKLENAAEDDYSSDSMSNALKRFTKQDIGAGDGESDIQPMQTVLETTEITTTTAHDLNETESDIEGKDVEDSLIKSDVKVKITSKVPPPSEPPSTQETYVQEGSDDSEEKKKSNGTKVNDETTTDINLESYDSSPKKYNKEKNQIEMTECANGVHVLSDYREHDAKLLKGIEHWKLRGHYMTRDSSEVLKPEPGRCYIRDSPEVVIRACVELVPQSRCLEETPAVLTCSVDVEQHRFEVTQVEVPIDLAANVIPKPGEKTCVFDQCPSVIVSDQSSVMSDDMGSSVSKEQSDGSSSSGWTVQSASTMERKQPEGREKPASTENMEGMLDRISHDLDYLLNRNTQAAKDNNTQPTKKKKTGLRVHIQEEEDVFLIESPKNSPNHS